MLMSILFRLPPPTLSLFRYRSNMTTNGTSKNIENDGEIWFRDVTGLNIADQYIPIFIGIVTVTILFLLMVIIFVVLHCVRSRYLKNNRETNTISTIEKSVPNNSNYSTFETDPKERRFRNEVRVVELIPEYDNSVHWLYQNHILSHVPPAADNENKNAVRNTQPRDSPDEIDARSFLSRPSKHVVLSPILSLDDYSLPQISQFSTQPCPYACSIFLDDHYISSRGVSHFRTRSLPSCVRFKKHSSAHPDTTVELYDKVNFSKKRKNRMRNDEAAIIALSRSRSQFFSKDTDSLVDNEAVIVYDERTAL